ncbi:AraC family transcriptional regulator [Gemmiger sp.]|uniref:AraC family transcriptional regulator n=1 Tax=Gemmiger sp. TaxID=2049027 RepID=UPI003A92F7DF
MNICHVMPKNSVTGEMTAPICVSRLSHTDQSIANIARQCGYVNQGRFAGVFYEKYDVKPLDYRRQTRLQTNET